MFKVGDRVAYTSGRHGDSRYNPLWGGVHGYTVGTIYYRYINACYVVWDNEFKNSYEDGTLTPYVSINENEDDFNKYCLKKSNV